MERMEKTISDHIIQTLTFEKFYGIIKKIIEKGESMWTYENEMIFESDMKDEHFAVVAYCDDESTYNEEDWNGLCDTFYEWF